MKQSGAKFLFSTRRLLQTFSVSCSLSASSLLRKHTVGRLPNTIFALINLPRVLIISKCRRNNLEALLGVWISFIDSSLVLCACSIRRRVLTYNMHFHTNTHTHTHDAWIRVVWLWTRNGLCVWVSVDKSANNRDKNNVQKHSLSPLDN